MLANGNGASSSSSFYNTGRNHVSGSTSNSNSSMLHGGGGSFGSPGHGSAGSSKNGFVRLPHVPDKMRSSDCATPTERERVETEIIKALI